VTVVKPGETLIIRVPTDTPVSRLREYRDVLTATLDDYGSPFRALVLPAEGLGVAEAPHEHTWKPCPNCPNPEGPCACAGAPCCDQERAEVAAELEHGDA
jgi:hypothetical protein